ncbi:MAG: hypothetical protein AAFX50_07575, partial [Acidobacteriota bacterium]
MSTVEKSHGEGQIRRLRRALRPLHPNRLRARGLHALHRLGWHRWMLWLAGLHPVRLARSAAWTRRFYTSRRRRRRQSRLTVAVDVSSLWQPMTGVGWYLFRLLEAMAERDDVRLRLYGPRLIDAGEAPAPARPLPSGPALEEVRITIPADFSVPREVLAPWLRGRIGRLLGGDGNA